MSAKHCQAKELFSGEGIVILNEMNVPLKWYSTGEGGGAKNGMVIENEITDEIDSIMLPEN